MCRVLDQSKASSAEAFFRNNNLPPETAYWFKGKSIPCVCGQKMYFKPDHLNTIVEAMPFIPPIEGKQCKNAPAV